MKNPELLWELQNLEIKKPELLKQSRKFPEGAELKLLKAEIESIQNDARGLNKEVNQLKKDIGEAEKKLSDLRKKYDKANDELYSGTHASRELEATQKNISVIKEKIEVEEEDILRLMEQLEELNNRMKEIIKILDEKKDLFRQVNKTYSAKKESALSKLEAGESRIGEIIKIIDPEELDEFNKLRQRYSDNCGIAVMENGICSGCHMTLSFEQLKHAKTKPGKFYCDNCGRFLLMK